MALQDFDAKSRSGHSGSGSGFTSSPEDRIVPAMETAVQGAEAAMHLGSFLGSPLESTPVLGSSSNDPVTQQGPQALSQSLHLHRHENAESHITRQEFNDNRSVRQHLQFQQSNVHMSAHPMIVAQAAVEVDIARRQTQEVYDQASREIAATRAQTQEVYDQASREIAATRALAQEEVLRQAREVIHQASQEVDASRAVAERGFHRLQSQVGALMGAIESQRDTIEKLTQAAQSPSRTQHRHAKVAELTSLVEKQRLTITNLQQQGSQNQPSETKSPSNGAGLAPTPSLGSVAQRGTFVAPGMSQGTLEFTTSHEPHYESTAREPRPSSHRPREVNPQTFLNPSGSSCGIVQGDLPVPGAPQYFPIITRELKPTRVSNPNLTS